MMPFYEKPREGEMLYSWIRRLAAINHLPLSYFAHSYLGIARVNKDTLPLDARLVFKALCEHIPVPVDRADLFFATSTFRMCAMAMTPEVQMRYLNNIWFPRDTLNHTVPGLFDEIRYCPECMKEDERAYGSYHMHAVHHLPGMRCCPKHGCALLYFKGTSKQDPDDFHVYEDVTESNVAYAKYAGVLYNAKIDTNIFDVKDVITERYEDLGYMVANGYGPLIRDLNKWEHGVLWGTCSSDLFLKTKLVKARNVTVTELIPLLMFLFPEPEDFIAALPEHEPLLETVTCFTCGKTYLASPTAVRQGWGCPECAAKSTVPERFKTLIDTAGNGEYELLSEFNSMTERVTMKHFCGRELSISPEYFIFRRGRCACTISDFDPYARVAAHPGFKLISYNGSHSISVFHHENCGQDFSCVYLKFLETPKCRACEPTRYTQETYVKAVQDLVGDEYTVIGEYKARQKPIEIRHNTCGKIHRYNAVNFLNGARCPECQEVNVLPFLDLDEALDTYSKGRYTLARINGRLEVTDTYTGECVSITQSILMQEINRPTPSPVLPLDGTEEEGYIPYWEKMCALLAKYSAANGSAVMSKYLWYEGRPLGAWKSRQVKLMKKNELPEEKISMLADAGLTPPRVLNTRGISHDENWDRRFSQLERCIKENGPGNFTAYSVYEDEWLGSWIMSQRKKYENGKLTKEQIDKLNSLDASILTPDTDPHGYARNWEICFLLLEKFIAEFGEHAIKQTTSYHDRNLGVWVYDQRKKYRAGTISKDAAERLASLMPDFFARPAPISFDENVERYRRCLLDYGHIDRKTEYENVKIGTWLYAQRAKYRAGALAPERVRKLLDVDQGFLTEELITADEAWERGFKRYEKFVSENGCIPIPENLIVDGRNLNGWAKAQREKYRKNKLTPDKVARLLEINPDFFKTCKRG